MIERKQEVNTIVETTPNMGVIFKNAHTGAKISECPDAYDMNGTAREGERLERELGCVFDTYEVEVEFSYPVGNWIEEKYRSYTKVVTGPTYMDPDAIGQMALDHEQKVWQNDEIVVDDTRSPR